MADSSALLSTCAGAGATMVAIVGGLLVSRFLAVESEALSAKKLVLTLDEKLADAKKGANDHQRAYERHALREMFLNESQLMVFFEVVVGDRDRSAITEGLGDAGFEEATVQEVADQFLQETERVLSFDWNVVPHTDQHQYWDDFRRAHDIRPTIDEIWKYMYLEICTSRPSRDPNPILGPGMDLATMDLTSVAEQNESRDARNRLITARDAAWSAVQQLESDRAAAALTRDSIQRPPGMVSGLAVLAALTVTGVVIPVLLLAPTPATLTYGQAVAVVACFFAGIAVLFAYLGTHAARLRSLTDR